MANPLIVNPNPTTAYLNSPAPGVFVGDAGTTFDTPYTDTYFGGALNKAAPMCQLGVVDLVPYAGATNSLAAAQAYTVINTPVTLISVTTQGNTVQTINGQTAILLDCPRNINITINASIAAQVVWTVTGLDIYKKPLVETITTPIAGAGQQVDGQKIFWCIFSVKGDVVLAGGKTIAVGCQNRFGLPQAIASANYIKDIVFDGKSFRSWCGTAKILNGQPSIVVNDLMMSPTTRVIATVVDGDVIALAATPTGGSVTFTSAIGNVGQDTDLSYVACNNVSDIVSAADTTSPATATTNDVRGSINLATMGNPFDHVKQLTIYYYVRGTNSQLNQALIASGQTGLATTDLVGVTQFGG